MCHLVEAVEGRISDIDERSDKRIGWPEGDIDLFCTPDAHRPLRYDRVDSP